MAYTLQVPKNPINPCRVPENEQLPAKVWELLRRNRAFRRQVEQLHGLHQKALATERSGPEWAESCDLIKGLQGSHPLAALSLQWLVPEPVFLTKREASGHAEQGEGLSPDLGDSSWIWHTLGAPKVASHATRGPVVTASRRGRAFKEWSNWKPGAALFDCDTPWRRLPGPFHAAFKRQWRRTYDSPHADEPDILNGPALPRLLGVLGRRSTLGNPILAALDKRGALTRDDFARLLEISDIVSRHRIFAVPVAMQTSKDAEAVCRQICRRLKSGLVERRDHLFGTENAWDCYFALEECSKDYTPREAMKKMIVGAVKDELTEAIRSHRKNVQARCRAIRKLISLVFPLFEIRKAVLVRSAPTRKLRRKPEERP